MDSNATHNFSVIDERSEQPSDLDASDLMMDYSRSTPASPTKAQPALGYDSMSQEDLAEQLAVVQDMVHEMKASFLSAMQELNVTQSQNNTGGSSMPGSNKTEQSQAQEQLVTDNQKQIAQLTDIVKTIQTDVGSVLTKLKDVSERQTTQHDAIRSLQNQRNSLLDELARNGAITEGARKKLRSDPSNALSCPQSDSGVNLHMNGESSSGDTTPPQISPLVQPYLDSLHTAQGNLHADSESSIVAEAKHSIDLANMLRQKYLDCNTSASSDDGNQHSSFEEIAPTEDRCLSDSKSHLTSNIKARHHQTVDNDVRQHMVQEIIASEREYCATLWTLLDDYVSPLQQMNLIGTRDLNSIFLPYLNQMHEQHCLVLRRMEERQWSGLIGEVFVKLTDRQENDLLTLYRDFVSDFPSAMNNLLKWKRGSRKFSAFLKNHHHGASSKGTDVSSLMLAPVQRISQYVIQIMQLMKVTPVTHPDYNYLVTSRAILRNLQTQLDDDIQHAVQMVDGANTTRSGGSIKSSDSSELAHLHSARDSGISHSTTDDVRTHSPARHIISRSRQHERDRYLKIDAGHSHQHRDHSSSHRNIHRMHSVESEYDQFHTNDPNYLLVDQNLNNRAYRNARRLPVDPRYPMDGRMTAPPVFVPPLDLNEYYEDMDSEMPIMGHQHAPMGSCVRQRPVSVAGHRMYDIDDRYSHLTHNRPRSAAGNMLGKRQMEMLHHRHHHTSVSDHTDPHAQFQAMMQQCVSSSRLQPRRKTFHDNRLSLSPEDEFQALRKFPHHEPQSHRGRDVNAMTLDQFLDQHSSNIPQFDPHHELLYGDQVADDEDDEEEDDTCPQEINFEQLPSPRVPLVKSKSQGCVLESPDMNTDISNEQIAEALAQSFAHESNAYDGIDNSNREVQALTVEIPVTDSQTLNTCPRDTQTIQYHLSKVYQERPLSPPPVVPEQESQLDANESLVHTVIMDGEPSNFRSRKELPQIPPVSLLPSNPPKRPGQGPSISSAPLGRPSPPPISTGVSSQKKKLKDQVSNVNMSKSVEDMSARNRKKAGLKQSLRSIFQKKRIEKRILPSPDINSLDGSSDGEYTSGRPRSNTGGGVERR